ncbi:hypothetical protein DPX16_0288 [Anabarilius grahami]|uniref:Uncharacterized protein n=1 Tax=Anabarilius grahami TaxID=495550 RepID=A0A3N0Y9T4_ANAGA|nr:hypothetical protein DPX16_0288 [Anabarilius grahami]
MLTIVGRSRFSAVFRRAFEATTAVTEEGESPEENTYYSPRIIQTLYNTYMAIFPMWSGVMLGDLKRHSADKDSTSVKDGEQRQDKTRETNCHVEGWFSILKQHILQKARRLRPGNFVCKMYASLQGRYTPAPQQRSPSPDHSEPQQEPDEPKEQVIERVHTGKPHTMD